MPQTVSNSTVHFYMPVYNVNWRTNYNEVIETRLIYHDLSRLSREMAHFVDTLTIFDALFNWVALFNW